MNVIATLFILALSYSITFGQTTSGSGTIHWAEYLCSGQTCDLRINQEDTYTIFAPSYGTFEITGQVTGNSYTCFTCDFQSSPIASSVSARCEQNLGSFGAAGNTFVIPCLRPGDSICVKFLAIGSGYHGDYTFTSTFIPDNPQGNEIEPNNTIETAQSLPIPYPVIEGHLFYGYGITIETRDIHDYFEIGYFEVGDSVHISYDPLMDNGSCQLLRQGSVSPLISISGIGSASHIVNTADIYYIHLTNSGNADCSPYELEISGDPGRREYMVAQDAINLDYNSDDDTAFIFGDFSSKSVYIINASGTIIEDLSGMISPISYDVTSLPSGQHFLVIKDNLNPSLWMQNIIKY